MHSAFMISLSLIAWLNFGQPEKKGFPLAEHALTIVPLALQDSTAAFSKLIFHTSDCFGSCPVIHLEILADRSIRFTGNYNKEKNHSEADSLAYGNFRGVLSEQAFNELLELIIQSKITALDSEQNPLLCCDGAIKTLILYQNGTRTSHKTMFESGALKPLIAYLYSLGQNTDLTRTEENFHFEK
ncbi:DUF6438 domain-containing protein [Algoriphagus halophytocola]|uniref:DUF6438 domain-containing protein n=1 Tax=Algoriphagus halophytocola TaxID=2991499 RepID=A0ABY6MMC0_9BACT|nr:DUF6438 domain-containing protein [Algoriphagus sp. TR-M5]UZD24313.1 DUF6438 domain-containing protein [Algoriphagus sp. TR-M5]